MLCRSEGEGVGQRQEEKEEEEEEDSEKDTEEVVHDRKIMLSGRRWEVSGRD